jgi:hypothetical protein
MVKLIYLFIPCKWVWETSDIIRMHNIHEWLETKGLWINKKTHMKIMYNNVMRHEVSNIILVCILTHITLQ